MAGYFPEILGAGEAVAGLFGSKRNPYQQQANSDFAQGRGFYNDQAGVGSQYGQLASSALGDYGQDNTAYRGAVANQEQYLSQNPYTSSYGAAQVAGQAGNTAQAYTAARAHLTASLAQRGLSDSGSAAGGLASLARGEAGAEAGLQNQVAMNSITNQGQRLGQLTSLEGSVAGQDYGRGTSALGAENNIYGSLGHDYMGLGTQEQGLGLQYQGAQNQMISDGIGAIAQGYAMQNPPAWLQGYGQTQGGSAGSGYVPNPYM